MMDNAPDNDTMIRAVALGESVVRFSAFTNTSGEIYEKPLILDTILLPIAFAVRAILSTS